MSYAGKDFERPSSPLSGYLSNGSQSQYNVDMETEKKLQQHKHKHRSSVKTRKIDVLKRNLSLQHHSHPHVGKLIKRLVKKTFHKPEHLSPVPSPVVTDDSESLSPTSPLPPLSFDSTPTLSSLTLSGSPRTPSLELPGLPLPRTPSLELPGLPLSRIPSLDLEVSTPSTSSLSLPHNQSTTTLASSTTLLFPDLDIMDSTTPTPYSPTMARRKSSVSVSEKIQSQMPSLAASRASSRRNTLTEKMPDLTPSHLNLVPPSPPMSPPPHTPTSQASFQSPTSSSSPDSIPHSDSEALSASIEKTIQTLLKGYSSLSVESLLSPLSSDFTHRVLPTSLSMPSRDRSSFSQHAAGIFSVFSQFAMIPQEIYTDLSHKSVTIHAKMEGILKGPNMEWKNECVMIVRLSSDGREVIEITEFVDSAKAMEMRARHAPRGFDGNGQMMQKRSLGVFSRMGLAMGMSGLAGERVIRWGCGSVLFTAIAAQTFWGVRRWFNGN